MREQRDRRAGLCLQHGCKLATAWLLLTDNFTLDSQWISSMLVNLPSPGCFLSNKKILYSVSIQHGWKDIWGDRLCSLLLLCNSTARDRIQSPVHKSVYHYPTNAPLNAFSFTIALLQSYHHLSVLFFKTTLILKVLLTQYMIQLEALLSKPMDFP